MHFLIEPYNAYQKPPRKKHWMEIVEEEFLYHQINEEQRRIDERLKNANETPHTKDSKTFHLLKGEGDMPSPSVGGGGGKEYAYFNPHIILNFTSSVQSGHIPFQVQFTNLTTGDALYINYQWDFGDGGTSTQENPKHNYITTGSFNVSLTGSARGNPSIVSYLRITNYISASL